MCKAGFCRPLVPLQGSAGWLHRGSICMGERCGVAVRDVEVAHMTVESILDIPVHKVSLELTIGKDKGPKRKLILLNILRKERTTSLTSWF